MRVSQQLNRHQAMGTVVPALGPTALPNNTLHLALFSGTPPTDDQLLAMLGSNQTVAWSTAAIAAFATATNFLADVTLLSHQFTFDPESMTLLLPMSTQANLFTVTKSDAPTWFMIRRTSGAAATDNFVGFTGGSTASAIIVGTVGDENSTADLKLVGGLVTTNTPVRVSDLRIKF